MVRLHYVSCIHCLLEHQHPLQQIPGVFRWSLWADKTQVDVYLRKEVGLLGDRLEQILEGNDN